MRRGDRQVQSQRTDCLLESLACGRLCFCRIVGRTVACGGIMTPSWPGEEGNTRAVTGCILGP